MSTPFPQRKKAAPSPKRQKPVWERHDEEHRKLLAELMGTKLDAQASMKLLEEKAKR